jgi:hypothetical protein
VALDLMNLTISATPQSEYWEDLGEYTSSVPYRNVIDLAAVHFDTRVYQYGHSKATGQNLIKEIDEMAND